MCIWAISGSSERLHVRRPGEEMQDEAVIVILPNYRLSLPLLYCPDSTDTMSRGGTVHVYLTC